MMKCPLLEKKKKTHSFKMINGMKSIKKRRDVFTFKQAINLDNTCLDRVSLKSILDLLNHFPHKHILRISVV